MKISHIALFLILVLVAVLWFSKDESNRRPKHIPNVERTESHIDDPDLYTIPPFLNQLSDAHLLEVYHRLTNSFSILCPNHMRIGPIGANGKEICADDKVKPKKPCLVYSFGMGRFKTINVPKNVTLHLKGLDGKTNRTKSLWTIDDLLEKLGHKGRVIDILKLDVEEYEWPALDQMMTSGTINFVRQLLVEFHMKVQKPTPRAEKAKRVTVLSRLYTYGFRTFSREKTPRLSEYVDDLYHPVSNLVEMSFINLRFLHG